MKSIDEFIEKQKRLNKLSQESSQRNSVHALVQSVEVVDKRGDNPIDGENSILLNQRVMGYSTQSRDPSPRDPAGHLAWNPSDNSVDIKSNKKRKPAAKKDNQRMEPLNFVHSTDFGTKYRVN